MKKSNENQVVELKKINIQHTVIELVGDTPLIIHAWSEKVKKGMLDKQMKKAKLAQAAKDPQRDYEEAFYRLENGKPGFPAVGFKASAVSASIRFCEGMKGTEVRGSFHIPVELVQIEGEPNMREDMVRIGMGTADIRYRPEFKVWRAKVPIRYNADAISLEQIVNLFNVAGFGVGIGEWRPEKDGSYGMFHVATDADKIVKEKKTKK